MRKLMLVLGVAAVALVGLRADKCSMTNYGEEQKQEDQKQVPPDQPQTPDPAQP